MSQETEITSNDRMWAALSWLPISPVWPVLAIVALVMDNTKNRSFIRHHAMTSIVAGLILIPISIITIGIGALAYLIFFYWAYMAYQGELVEVPWLSNFMKEKGWI
jgi:uncharacterized membrane protein